MGGSDAVCVGVVMQCGGMGSDVVWGMGSDAVWGAVMKSVWAVIQCMDCDTLCVWGQWCSVCVCVGNDAVCEQ